MAGSRSPAVGGSAKAAKPQKPVKKLTVPFEDNRAAAELFGEFDANLAVLEARLGVEAIAHGNILTLSGPEDSCQLAREVLEELYERASRGAPIATGDVEGAIRHIEAKAERSRSEERGAAPEHGMGQIRTRRRQVLARTPTQSTYVKALEESDLVFAAGPAGTGKTYMAVAYAASCLERGVVERIVLSRPAVEAGERLGFLPGDMREKVDPYLRPLYDALYDVLPPEKVERGLETGEIEIAPLAFMRGRTLAHAFVILDEAQNSTPMQMKMFLTRLGEGSHMVVTGDPSQVDLAPGQASGLEEAMGLLHGVEGIAIVRFTRDDVVRRALVARIVAAYEKAEAR